ncbi:MULTISPECIES: potassium transporter Kup [Methylobacterium]|uniref:Probable potassium transport system protein Kup n=3 Tax=Methylobacterium TaxID=407 RepID=A0A509EE76_9HYPH|nr:KUP system potassium uptake protein [Methylobacterium brachiatum]GJD56258.1 Low affinity potassium transport system protein kup [Methylobacterium dankookense]VUD72408.1 Low affinity potassium transport system protein kup [Methylobacterium symbioticum]VUF13635.1 Low affinity potassium transport system protein kup [Methylobacterium dankookense]
MAVAIQANEAQLPARTASVALSLGALGIVYGDIGTSPLYALKETVKVAAASGPLQQDAVLGSVSLILWSLFLIVALKYAILILRADNHGEGGIVAMLALLGARHAPPRSWRALLLVVGLIGAALLYGDGAITPAISVLSAVEGLKVDAPGVTPFVVPATVVILIGLFSVQRKGTGFIGRLFGPVMLLWFATIAVVGAAGIRQNPEILAALNPFHAVHYLVTAHLPVSFAMLGAAFLAVTGGEAMYADLGHFGRAPIRMAWFTIVLPALVLNYLGQGALLLSNPEAVDNPFFQLAPGWIHYLLVAFATLATVIASQAIISGAFSLTEQAIKLGFFPRMRIVHTSGEEAGQIYVPIVNWLLAIATLGAVLAFGSSDALAGAYGIAVSLLMVITTVLAALIAVHWGFNLALVLAVNGAFLLVDLTFFSANTLKLFEGGWFPLLLAAGVAFLMLTWRRGTQLVEAARVQLRMPEEEFLRRAEAKHLPRIPGTGAFLTSAEDGMPLPLMNFVRHLEVLHERVLLITVQTLDVPHASEAEQVAVVPIAQDVTRVILRFGFMDTVHVPRALRRAGEDGRLPGVDVDRLSYFISHETVVASEKHPGMAGWREEIFALMQRNAEETASYFCVPARQVMEVGTEVEV